MFLAMTENQWVGLDNAETNRALADIPGSVAFSTPYSRTLLILFLWRHLLLVWSSAVPLSGIDLENDIKQDGHACPLVSIFFPDVSAGH
jgi:hypothetical protein